MNTSQMTEAEINFRASIRSKSLETAADSLYLAAILATRRPGVPPYLAAIDAAALQRIGKAIAALAVAQCNTGLTDKQESRWERLAEQAGTIASWYGLTASAHGDPRGYVLRLHGDGLPANGFGDGFGVA